MPLVFCCLLAAQSIELMAQGFKCEHRLMLLQRVANDTFAVCEYLPTHDGVDLIREVKYNVAVAGAGYHKPSGSVLALERDSNRVLLLSADGSVVVAGVNSAITRWTTRAVDCLADGSFVVYNAATSELKRYVLTPVFQEIASIPVQWENGMPFDVILDDLVSDPLNPSHIYAYQRNYFQGSNPDEPPGTRGHLLRINFDTLSADHGTVTSVGQVPANIARHFGGLMFDGRGQLYGFGSIDTVQPIMQDRLVRINKFTAESDLVTNTIVSAGSDGCTCPFGVSVDMRSDAVLSTCDGHTIYYGVTIRNFSPDTLKGLQLSDTFPDGMRLNEIALNDLPGFSGSDSNSRAFHISEITLPPFSEYLIGLSTFVPNADGAYITQAILSGLPDVYGGEVFSDNPVVRGSADPDTVLLSEYASETAIFIDTTICPGEVFKYNDLSVTEEGFYLTVIENPIIPGCDTVVHITLEYSDPIDYRFTYPDTIYGNEGDIAPLYVEGDTEGWSIQWPDRAGIRCRSCFITNITLDSSINIVFMLTSDDGCSLKDSIRIRVKESSDVTSNTIYVPNIFSPNGDGNNDQLTVSASKAGTLEQFTVYDRWGSRIHLTENRVVGPGGNALWDGTIDGRPAPTGVYLYTLRYTDESGDSMEVSGDITILR